jgi:hypothetical protein
VSDSFLTLSFDWTSITSCKEVIDLKKTVANIAFAAFITANAVVCVALALSVAYYVYVDFIR